MGQVMKNNRNEKIDGYLKEKLTPRFYDFWVKITEGFPLPFDKPSSSSGKYHQSTAGTVHNLEEHTFDLLKFVDKLSRIFGDSKEESHYDLLMLAAALHDITKYGAKNNLKHTTKDHDVIAAKLIKERGVGLGLTETETEILSGLVLYHSGRWASINPGFKPVIPFTQLQLFIHVADMCSTARILQFE